MADDPGKNDGVRQYGQLMASRFKRKLMIVHRDTNGPFMGLTVRERKKGLSSNDMQFSSLLCELNKYLVEYFDFLHKTLPRLCN